MPRGWQPGSGKNFRSFLKGIYHTAFKRTMNLEKLCFDRAIPYNKIYKGNEVQVTSWVKEINPDMIVVFSMSQLLKDLIDIPKHGVVNLHLSMLPEYRGPNPDFWQYYKMKMNPV